MALTRQEIVARIGRVDDLVIAAIIASGATGEELDEACAWIANDEPLMNSGGGSPPAGSGRSSTC